MPLYVILCSNRAGSFIHYLTSRSRVAIETELARLRSDEEARMRRSAEDNTELLIEPTTFAIHVTHEIEPQPTDDFYSCEVIH